MNDPVWRVDRRGKKVKVVADDKATCPKCGEQARKYVDGSWERHKSFDYDKNGRRKGRAYSWCNGK